jgi:hypothetical protein
VLQGIDAANSHVLIAPAEMVDGLVEPLGDLALLAELELVVLAVAVATIWSRVARTCRRVMLAVMAARSGPAARRGPATGWYRRRSAASGGRP